MASCHVQFVVNARGEESIDFARGYWFVLDAAAWESSAQRRIVLISNIVVIVGRTLADHVSRDRRRFFRLEVQPAVRTSISPQKGGPESCLANKKLKMHGDSRDANLSIHSWRKLG